MEMKCRFLSVVLCLGLGGSGAQAQRVGHPAPPIQVDKYLRGPDGRGPSWEELRGKAIVLEFFATWCGPCVKVGDLRFQISQDTGHRTQDTGLRTQKPEARSQKPEASGGIQESVFRSQ